MALQVIILLGNTQICTEFVHLSSLYTFVSVYTFYSVCAFVQSMHFCSVYICTACEYWYSVCIFTQLCTFSQCVRLHSVCIFVHVRIFVQCSLYGECTWTSNLVSHRNDGVWHGQGCSSPAHEKLVNERQWNARGFHRISHFAVSEATILNSGVPFNYYLVCV